MTEKPEIPPGLPPSIRESIERKRYFSQHPEERARYQAARQSRLHDHFLGGLIGAVWVTGAMVLGILVWITVAVIQITKDPGVGGWLSGIFGGFVGALISMLLAMLPVFIVYPFMEPLDDDDADVAAEGAPGAPDAALAATLTELEAVRQQAQSQIPKPRPVFVPIGAGAFFVFGLFSLEFHRGPLVAVVLLLLLAVLGAVLGAAVGYSGAAAGFFSLDKTYGALYLQRVVPKLLAGFGELAWLPKAEPPLDEIRRYRMFPPWNSADRGDEIQGQYRGLPLSICGLSLVATDNRSSHTVFAGLLTMLTLPRALHGITVVSHRQGVFGDLAERWRDLGAPQSLQAVQLEDPVFSKSYEVQATDQVSARALLTPAFMERFMALAKRMGAASLLVKDDRLLIAVPTGPYNFFLPPSFREPAAARARLTRLRENIATLLGVADAVIDLDQSARQLATATADA